MSKDQKLNEIFNSAILTRNTIRYKLNRTFFDYISFMQTKIRKQLNTFTLMSICGGQRSKFAISQYFQSAYTAMNLQQKVDYFHKTVNLIRKAEDQKQNNVTSIQTTQLQKIKSKYGQEIRFIIQVNTGFRSWQQQTISISGFKINSHKKINIDLRNYLLRKSKKKDVNCHVLQAIRSSKPQTIRFCFKRKQEEDKYFPLILDLIEVAQLQHIFRQAFSSEIGIMRKNTQTGMTKISLGQSYKFKKLSSNNIKDINQNLSQIQINVPEKKINEVSVSYELMRSKDQQEIYQDLKDLIDKQNQKIGIQTQSKFPASENKLIKDKKIFKNIFSIMLPSYNLHQIESLQNFQTIQSESSKGIYIFRNRENHNHFKMQILLTHEISKILNILQNVQLYKIWHPSINQSQQKFRICSQNCSIFYQKHKPFSKWYKERDYLYLKHVFYYQDSYYLVDKSFENTNFIPFQSIVRGKIIHCVTKIKQNGKGGSKIIMDINIDHGGLLNESHSQDLTINYLNGFLSINNYFLREQNINKLVKNFDHNWDITEPLNTQYNFQKNNSTYSGFGSCDFDKASQISKLDQSQVYFSVDDLDQQLELNDNKSQHQIQQKQIEAKQQMMKSSIFIPNTIKLDENGRIILPQNYFKKNHIVKPLAEKSKNRIQNKFENYILQDNWAHLPEGGLQIINQKKIQAQNNVFGFILKKLRQNIFSGKGLTNISLPVQVFNCDSNLSRSCRGFSLAPDFLQKAAKSKDSITRMKYSILFGLSCSLFYLDAQKPFNPILGQTYQGLIDGCPVYAQQISHHPPISSFYMSGRGYKIYGSIQAKVHIHMNSADGINQGFYYIQFDDGQIIGFNTPPGEVSNITMGGNRKFNFLDKGYYFDQKNKLYCQLKFKQEGGFFGKTKWNYKDQVEGQILKVKDNYINKVIEKIKQKKSPSQKQIQEKFDKVTGRWVLEVLWDKQIVYRPNQDLPYEMNNYQYSLPSDCFYRQDIYYRIKDDLARSQIQKQRLEVVQRGDRKLREKYTGKSSH